MASGDGGSVFVGFITGALVVVVALIGVAAYLGHEATDTRLTFDTTRPSLPSTPR
jgi:hypothetical protein